MLVVGCSRHHLNSLSESFSSWLMKSSCQGEATGFPALPSGSSHVTGVGDDVIFPFRSRGGGGWDGQFERPGIVSSNQKVGFQAHFMVPTPRAGLFRE